MVISVRARDSAVGQDDLGAFDMVDGQAIVAREETLPAGGRESAYANPAVVAGADGQTVWCERLGDVAPPSAWADAHKAALTVNDLDAVESA